MSKNIPATYEKFKTALGLVGDHLDKTLPKLTGNEFLENFGTEFQAQLSVQGKSEFPIFQQTILNSAQEKFDIARENRETIYKQTINEFLSTFDLEKTLSHAQVKLNKNKENLLQALNNLLNKNSQNFSVDDKDNIKDAFTKKLSEDYQKLNNHLEGWKSLLPSTFAKIQFHLDAAQAKNREKKNSDFTIDQLPEFEKLKTPVKPEPKVGYKVDIKNIKEQILNDIANEKEVTIKLIDTQNYSYFKKIADIGFQYQSPGLALLHLIILLFAKIIYNNEKRTTQAIQELIEEGHLIDPEKIRIKIVNPRTANESEAIVRKEGPLDEKNIIKLQTIIGENKKDLSNYNQETQTKKSGLTPTESGYNSEEEEEIPHSRPRP